MNAYVTDYCYCSGDIIMETVLPKDIGVHPDQLLKHYYLLKPKMKLAHICNLLNEHHQHPISLRQLKYKIKKLHLQGGTDIDQRTLMDMVINELGNLSLH